MKKSVLSPDCEPIKKAIGNGVKDSIHMYSLKTFSIMTPPKKTLLFS